MLCLWSGDQDGGRDDEVHSPKFLMACDVLRRDAPCTFAKGRLVAGLFVRSQLALRMREEVGPIAIQNESQEQFGVHLWRGDLFRSQAGRCGG